MSYDPWDETFPAYLSHLSAAGLLHAYWESKTADYDLEDYISFSDYKELLQLDVYVRTYCDMHGTVAKVPWGDADGEFIAYFDRARPDELLELYWRANTVHGDPWSILPVKWLQAYDNYHKQLFSLPHGCTVPEVDGLDLDDPF